MDHVKRTLSAIPVKAWLWMIIGLGVMARLGAVLMMGDAVQVLPGIYDQVSYHTLATRLLGGHGFTFETEWWPVTQAGEPTAHWSYLYTFYLTIVYALVGVPVGNLPLPRPIPCREGGGTTEVVTTRGKGRCVEVLPTRTGGMGRAGGGGMGGVLSLLYLLFGGVDDGDVLYYSDFVVAGDGDKDCV
jgi:hypothetical protein